MNRPQIFKKTLFFLMLLFLPLSIFAADSYNFFTPAPNDISFQIMSAIFGSGTDNLNGKLIRPLLLVMCSGMVIFMGVIFAWNITKFVLHTSQQGEMMVGKGKELGLVLLRSVFGMAMVLPIYSGTYKGLCMAFIFVGWLITQGIGLADRGTEAVVGYLTEGGTVYQIPQSQSDLKAKQDIAATGLTMLAIESCVYKLKAMKEIQDGDDQKINEELKKVGLATDNSSTVSTQAAIGSAFVPGRAIFGTRDTTQPNVYLGECGSLNWPLGDAKDPRQSAIRSLAVQKMMIDLEPLAKRIALISLQQPPQVLPGMIHAGIASAVIDYANLVGPLRISATEEIMQKNKRVLSDMLDSGWIVLGAYYPMMGELNRQAKIVLDGFVPSAQVGRLSTGQIASDTKSAYDPSRLSEEQRKELKNQFTYLTDPALASSVKEFITALETDRPLTLQERLAQRAKDLTPRSPSDNPIAIPSLEEEARRATGGAREGVGKKIEDFTNQLPGSAPIVGGIEDAARWGVDAPAWGGQVVDNAVNFLRGKNQAARDVRSFFGLSDNTRDTGVSLGNALSLTNISNSKDILIAASIPAGPLAWVSIIPMLNVFEDVILNFKDAIDQEKNADPLLALQKFGFGVLDSAVKLLLLVMGATFVTSFALSWIPSVNPAGGLGAGSAMDAPLLLMFFAGFAALGVGFGIYIPMIPFVVWISAILGWIGHSFQAVVGAPLVALRMTTAEGEGMLGGAVEGTMMLVGVLLTPFLLVIGLTGSLILIKQLMIVINYLFSLFVYYSFSGFNTSIAWMIIGVPAILFIYFTLTVTVVQSICTKLIGEMPSEVLRHLHSAMTGHKAAEHVGQKLEQATDKMGGGAGDLAGKKVHSLSGVRPAGKGGG